LSCVCGEDRTWRSSYKTQGGARKGSGSRDAIECWDTRGNCARAVRFKKGHQRCMGDGDSRTKSRTGGELKLGCWEGRVWWDRGGSGGTRLGRFDLLIRERWRFTSLATII
jgi:hypothetical protein